MRLSPDSTFFFFARPASHFSPYPVVVLFPELGDMAPTNTPSFFSGSFFFFFYQFFGYTAPVLQREYTRNLREFTFSSRHFQKGFKK